MSRQDASRQQSTSNGERRSSESLARECLATTARMPSTLHYTYRIRLATTHVIMIEKVVEIHLDYRSQKGHASCMIR